MNSILVLQHAQVETLGTLESALRQRGFAPQIVRTFAGDPVPSHLGAARGLILMGGPMSVYEQNKYPHLQEELHLLRNALAQQKPILGICLGSQLLAASLGARVFQGAQKEIGWHPVQLTQFAAQDPLWQNVPSSFVAFHWHGDCFNLPPHAVPLASSQQTPIQAFRYGANAYGLLFHLEVTPSQIEGMVQTFGEEVRAACADANTILGGMHPHLPSLQQIGQRVFQRWAALL